MPSGSIDSSGLTAHKNSNIQYYEKLNLLDRGTPLAYIYSMVFVETSVFTSQIIEFVDDDSYAELQSALVLNPELGDIIRNSGGLRKIRWRKQNTGKRGGIRLIYYYRVAHDQIMFLFVYPKSSIDDLTPQQLKLLSEVVKEWK